ncbi:hypothetical protein RUM43_009483 [Polyplax serrata]|uniref:ADF-H domain-containing protein n=1 Tax=Polyplax serrata TaxID=468196 RepID=A0AAN8NZN5_POLSC
MTALRLTVYTSREVDYDNTMGDVIWETFKVVIRVVKWKFCYRAELTTAHGHEAIKVQMAEQFSSFRDRNAAYDQFLDDLQKGGTGECRYGLFDFEYTHQCQGTSEASKKQKLFLISWCPDTAKVKKKMLYSSSFDALKKSLIGVQKYIQATDLSEASQEAVEEKLRATDRQ